MRHFDGAITAEHLANGKEKSATTTQLVSKITLSNGRTISYKYDEEERINKVIDSLDGIIVYDYDALGQLKTETVNGTVVNAMSYDNYGNITEKNGVAYTYDTSGVWKDLLTQVGTDESGKIEYDANGNPIKYLGHDLDWEKGRQLKRFDNITYTYNASGIRTSKTVNEVKHTYTLDGTKILCETWEGNTLIPLYDNEDGVCGILYNNVPYYFIKNLQGDVIAIVNKDAQTVARYSYDAWGAVTSAVTYTELTKNVDIATINPFRYRGYYYDEEIGLYYLQSRYYDATVGRFVNGDSVEIVGLSMIILDHFVSNLFGYCCNNPVTDQDAKGALSEKQLAQSFSSVLLLSMFSALLMANRAKAIVAVGAYVTKVATPIAAKAFWWKPWLIAVIVVAAVAIVVASVLVLYNQAVSKTEKSLPDIAGKYGNLKCKEAADAMKAAILKMNLHGSIVDLYFPYATNGYVISDRTGPYTAISENGHHYGVLFNNNIHCNIYPEGLYKDVWPTKFHATNDTKRISYIPF